MDEEAGFTLIETVCSLAVVGLLAALVLPAIPQGTSQARLAGYAVDIAALLKGDRNAAIRNRVVVAATLAQRCANRPTGSTIEFFPSGASCGGAIAISRHGVGYQIRVNWLTGGVEIVAIKA